MRIVPFLIPAPRFWHECTAITAPDAVCACDAAIDTAVASNSHQSGPSIAVCVAQSVCCTEQQAAAAMPAGHGCLHASSCLPFRRTSGSDAQRGRSLFLRKCSCRTGTQQHCLAEHCPNLHIKLTIDESSSIRTAVRNATFYQVARSPGWMKFACQSACTDSQWRDALLVHPVLADTERDRASASEQKGQRDMEQDSPPCSREVALVGTHHMRLPRWTRR